MGTMSDMIDYAQTFLRAKAENPEWYNKASKQTIDYISDGRVTVPEIVSAIFKGDVRVGDQQRKTYTVLNAACLCSSCATLKLSNGDPKFDMYSNFMVVPYQALKRIADGVTELLFTNLSIKLDTGESSISLVRPWYLTEMVRGCLPDFSSAEVETLQVCGYNLLKLSEKVYGG